MKCKECGNELSGSEVFCPQCGMPLRVTADYDYIQAEIGEKVDQLLNDTDVPENEKVIEEPALDKQEQSDTIIIDTTEDKEVPNLNIIGDMIGDKPIIDIPLPVTPPPAPRKPADDLAVTRTIDISDSIYTELEEPEDEYDDDFYEDDEIDDADDSTSTKEEYIESRQARKERAIRRAKKRRAGIIITVLIVVLIAAGIAGFLYWRNNRAKKEAELDDKLTCSVENGATYTAPVEITFASEKGYRVVYTLDGSEPTLSGGKKYDEPIVIANSDVEGDSMQVTLNAATFTSTSSLKAASTNITFTITKATVDPPTFSHESGTYSQQEYVTIESAPGTTIHFTYDGTTPSTSSQTYSEPIEMLRGNNILSAIAVDETGSQSEVVSCVYNLNIEPNISYDEAFTNVVNTLLQEGLIQDTEKGENDSYKVAGGGTRRVLNNGTTLIGNTNYYVLQIDFLNDESTVSATTYYGVDDQTGQVVKLNKNGMNYEFG